MKLSLSNKIDHIMILGAGASVDYGLPVWGQLNNLVQEKIKNDTENVYKYKNEIIEWMSNVGDGKKYKTIDKCIQMESVALRFHTNGHEIENEVFKIFKEIFIDKYNEPEVGWIKRLNGKILLDRELRIENKIAFINYNYDNVLNRNFLNYEYLPSKQRVFNYKPILDYLEFVTVPALYPHGNLFPEEVLQHIEVSLETIKTGNKKFFDVVSCYESIKHTVGTTNNKKVNLYFAGLGGGMETNIDNINFTNDINQIYVTIKDESIKKDVINYLSLRFNKQNTDITVFSTCDELVDNCFDMDIYNF